MPEKMRPRGKRGVWYADCRHNGVRVRDCLGTTDRRMAERRLAELLFSVDKGDYEVARMTFDELVERYKVELLPQKSVICQVNYESILRLHLGPAFAGENIAEIVKIKALHYVLERNNANIPESSLKKERRILQEIIRQVLPGFEIPRVRFRNKGKFFDKFLKESDVEAITELMKPKYRLVTWIGLYTGLRLGNVLNLTWSDVDLVSGWISVNQTKTGVKVKIPICAKLDGLLRNHIRILGSARLFNISRNSYYPRFKSACTKLGHGWARPHDMRHSFISIMLNAGVDHVIVAKLSGHKTVKLLLERYGHLSDDTLQKAMTVFDGVHKLSTKKEARNLTV